MGALPDDIKAKVMSMSKDELPLAERRRLYNQMARRCKSENGLPPGLVQQYTACLGNLPKRFEMLKHFICDRDMRFGFYQVVACPDLRQSCTVEAEFKQ